MLCRDDPSTTFAGLPTYCREISKEIRKRHQVDWFIGVTDRNTLNLGGKIPNSYDLVYAVSLPYGARVKLPLIVKTNSPIKEEGRYYSGFFKKLKGYYGQLQEIATLKKAKAVISVSQISHDILLKEYSAESTVIPDGVDLEKFRPEKVDGEVSVMICSRDEPRKNLPLAEKALASLDGSITKIRVLGNVPQEDLESYFRRADIFLTTSISEAFNQTCLQAMASGCSVLASDIPAHRELIEHRENGIIFGNEQQMKSWLDELIKNPEMRTLLGGNARKKAENYPWAKTAKLTEAIFESVLT